ncbi:MAG: DUF4214 domain-containing protein [Myxococcales bacterium]|nr:DUF4214 domain-containing protein [Myxococcales bacterium]
MKIENKLRTANALRTKAATRAKHLERTGGISKAEKVEKKLAEKAAKAVGAERLRDAFEPTTSSGQTKQTAEADKGFVTELYRTLLQREPDAEGLMSHLRGLERGMSRDEIVDVFRRSPEFAEVQARGATSGTASATSGTASATSGTASATSGTASATSETASATSGTASKVGTGEPPVFTGFDAARLGADLVRKDGVAQSAKYTFAKLAQASGSMPTTRAEAEQWFTEHIKPGLEQEGFGVDWVQGDKALVRTRENPQGEVIDFVRAADSQNRSELALAWQSEGSSGTGSVSGVTGKGAVGGSGHADRDFVMSVLSNHPPTNDGIQRAVAELRKHPGYEHAVILEHPLRLDKIDFGRGTIVDVVVGSGGPNPSWGWMPE